MKINLENNSKGVTLIALVITIIVLLILAAVSITALIGQEGILTKAKQAVQNTVDAEADENTKLGEYENYLDKYLGGDSAGGSLPTGEGTIPYLPGSDFTQIPGTSLDINSSFVIKDTVGNEWVWIEVPKTGPKAVDYVAAGATDNTKTAEIENALKEYTSAYNDSYGYYKDEWYSEAQAGIASSNNYNILKNKMLASIYDNEGFYIGRYEVGTDTARTESSIGDISATALIQKDKYLYNYVTCKEAQTLATGLNSGEKTSSLMFGIQWDLVLRYLENKGVAPAELNSDSTSWGNYMNVAFNVENTNASWYTYDIWTKITDTIFNKAEWEDKLLTTGATERNSKNKIYDLAGNVWEWTLEYTSDTNHPCVSRGGYCNYVENYSTNGWLGNDETCSDVYIGFRPAIY